jgi:hypothetical protein
MVDPGRMVDEDAETRRRGEFHREHFDLGQSALDQ